MALTKTARRATLIAAVLGSGATMLDESAIFVAVPAIERDLGIGLAGQQWVVNAYLLTLSAFLLLGGALGDLFGRRRLLLVGALIFGGSSLAAGLAPSGGLLIAARAVEGFGAALLMPASLALIAAVYTGDERPAAIGSWAAWSGIAAALGPLLAGGLIGVLSWRWVLFLNLPLAAATAIVAIWRVPESRDESVGRGDLDPVGALLAAAALGGLSFALVQGKESGWTAPAVLLAAGVGALALPVFLLWEARRERPMLPLDLFRSRNFSAANGATLGLYGAFNGAFFILMIYLQSVLGYSAFQAGAAALPLTLVFLALSSRLGRLSNATGPRLPMVAGQLSIAAALAHLALFEPGDSYLTSVLPGMVVFGLGLAVAVPPLTNAAMSSAPDRAAGKASGVNNTAARLAGLIAIAILGLVYSGSFRAALTAPEEAPAGVAEAVERAEQNPSSALDIEMAEPVRRVLEEPMRDAAQRAYRNALLASTAMVLIGALLAWLGVRNPRETQPLGKVLRGIVRGRDEGS